MKKITALLICVLLIFQTGIMVFADDETDEVPCDEFGRGLATMTKEQWDAFNAKIPMIVDVKPNSIALNRTEESTKNRTAIYADTEEEVQTAELGSEMTYVYPGQSSGGSVAPSEFPLTRAVDVSQSLTFPPIGNQGSMNSCVAWSLTYYQLTNNNCAIRGLNAKTASGGTVNANIMSPRFTYTLINGGFNVPTFYDEACAAVMSYGAPSANDFSSAMNTSNIKGWCTSADTWTKAIYNKPQKITYGYINTSSTVNSETQGVVNLKRILSNGYVVTIPTFVNSFNYTKNTTGRVWGCRYASDTDLGGHAMTVVGYDDDFWVDVNGNGRRDSGETGAFKIANSWGTNVSNYTNGYVWVPYDALGNVSAVSGATTKRSPVFSAYYFIEPQKDYTPLLVADVTMKTDKRNQVAIELGVSDAESSEPKSMISAVNNYNIAFNTMAKSLLVDIDNRSLLDKNFSGGNGNETVTIPFDLTPVIKKAYGSKGFKSGTTLKLYVKVTDDVNNGSSVTLNDVKITEPITGREKECSDKTILTANNNSVVKTVDFNISPIVGHSETQDITVMFNSNIRESSLSGNISLKTPNNSAIEPEYSVNGNRLTVYSPETENLDGYESDTRYELELKPQIKSLGGNNLINDKKIYIYILDDFYVYW